MSTRHLFAIPVWMGEGIREVLASFGATYREESDDGDVVLIDLDQLALPYTYGIGTEPELDGGWGG